MRRVRSAMRGRDDAGFSLLEVISTCLLLGIMVGLVVGPWRSWQQARSHKDAVRGLVSVLRNAQTSAVAENVTYRVDITANRVTTYRLSSTGPAEQKQQYTPDESKVSFANAAFAGSPSTSVFFYPRGAASKGSVDVVRTGRSKVYTISVEGLTGRVSYTE